jgi:aldehyde:ferredoxin oxidoreductase
MEAFEAGMLTTADTGGMEIKFGDADTMVKLVRMIGERDGFGDILAEGSEMAAEKIGRGAQFLITAKGQEAPAHMPQVKRSLALIYAVNPFGADHMSSEHDLGYDEGAFPVFKDRYECLGLKTPQPAQGLGPRKVEFACKTQQIVSLMDSLSLCQFAWGSSWQLYGPDKLSPLIKAVTGWDVTMDELLKVGERRINMMRAFNAREGFDSKRDTLSEKFFAEGLKGGPTDGWKIDREEFENARVEYYRQCGWDESTGVPKRETLDRLGLDWVADDLGL